MYACGKGGSRTASTKKGRAILTSSQPWAKSLTTLTGTVKDPTYTYTPPRLSQSLMNIAFSTGSPIPEVEVATNSSVGDSQATASALPPVPVTDRPDVITEVSQQTMAERRMMRDYLAVYRRRINKRIFGPPGSNYSYSEEHLGWNDSDQNIFSRFYLNPDPQLPEGFDELDATSSSSSDDDDDENEDEFNWWIDSSD